VTKAVIGATVQQSELIADGKAQRLDWPLSQETYQFINIESSLRGKRDWYFLLSFIYDCNSKSRQNSNV